MCPVGREGSRQCIVNAKLAENVITLPYKYSFKLL